MSIKRDDIQENPTPVAMAYLDGCLTGFFFSYEDLEKIALTYH